MVKQLRRIPSPCERLSLVERHIPPRSNMHHTRQRLESRHSGQKNHDHFFKRSCLLNPAQGENMDPHRAQGREDSCGLSREDDSRVRPADHQNRGRKRRHKEPEEPKRKHRRERDSHKENGGLGRPRGRADPVSAEKPRHRKKNHQDGDTTKERRRHQDKKRSGTESLEELDLWDEAVLSNY
ncbi:hypothetical protein TREES_T100021228 [Tupaia chinensis]|uniref:Uncharacterized protein n=1 Tax=Tupaia chinensis TaxID=246437 RepID=L8Y3D6_TUPCH|nr:hypothetical protein TREES_T100021228 [Tupaia chinensis]